MMKKLILILPILMLLACNREAIPIYDGGDFIMFSDSLYRVGVLSPDEWFDLSICATRACKHNRNVGVEIIEKESSAADGWHFVLESSTVTIPAGELTASVRLKAYPEHLEAGKNLRVTLGLVIPEENEWELYGTKAKVEMIRCAAYSREAFTGWMIVSSSYAMSYLSSYKRLVRSDPDPDDPDGIILRNFLYDGYDIRLHLCHEDRLQPLVSYTEQVFAGTDVAFGTLYGDGKILLTAPVGYVSYFSTVENFILFYMTLYVKDVGTVGNFANLCERISDEEAERILKEGF